MKSTQALLGVSILSLLTLNLLLFTTQTTQAAPGDVFGSPNVAVTGFKTIAGSYVLFTNGRITRLPDASGRPDEVAASIDTPDAYEDVPNRLQSRPIQGGLKGSPNVAVGILPSPQGTFVIFADGTLKKPSDVGASAPPPGDVVSARVSTGPGGVSSSVIVTNGCSTTFSPAGAGQASVDFTFDTAFSAPPIVLVSAINTGNNLNQPYVESNSTTTTGCTIKYNFNANGPRAVSGFYMVAVPSAN